MKNKVLNIMVIDEKKRWLLLGFAFLILTLTGIFYTIYGEKYIYQDGSWYFFDVLSTRGFITYPIGRQTVHMMQQLPVLLACRYGISNIKTIAIIFGLSYSVFIYLFWGLTIAVCKKHKRIDLAELFSVYLIITVLFIGFFTIIESTVGAALYCFELSLFMLHEDRKEAASVFEMLLMIGVTALTLHFNEYFVVWSVILAGVLVYRIYKKQISVLWLLVAFAHICIAYQSKADMAGRGAESQPKFAETILRLLQNKPYFVYMAIIIVIILLSYDFVDFKGKNVIIVLLEITLGVILAKRVFQDSASIAVGSYPMRFTTFGWGICLGVFIVLVEIIHRNKLKHDLIWLCLILTVITAFFNRRTAHQLRDFHTWEVGYCYNNPNRGYIPIDETGFQGSVFNADWVGTLGALDAEMIRGITEIGSVIDIKWADVYGRLDPERGQPFQQFGILINYQAFEDNPQLPEYFD